MKKRHVLTAVAALVTVTAMPASAADHESCAPGESDARAVQPIDDETIVYETTEGWGISGPRGYLEVGVTEHGASAHGSTRDGDDGDATLDGRLAAGAQPDACLNGTEV